VKILHKYVLKEHLGPLVFSLTTLTSLLLLNYIAKRFGDLVGKGLGWTVIAEFFGLSIPFTLALTFPMAVLVATLYAFSRLAAENEITALKASGVSLRAILAPVLVAAGAITVFMIFFNDQILPRSNHTLAKLQRDIAQKKPTFALREQVINDVQPGRLYLRANHIDEGSNQMREVTIYDLSDPTRRRTIYADSGLLAMAPNQTDLVMTLYDGNMQDVPTDNPAQLQRLFFKTDEIVVRGVTNQFRQNSGDDSKGQREMTVCEMQAQVDQFEQEYALTLQGFVQNRAMAIATDAKLSPEVLNMDTTPPSKFSLGRTYCALLSKLGVKTLGAQEPDSTVTDTRQQDSAKGQALQQTPEDSSAGAASTTNPPSPAVGQVKPQLPANLPPGIKLDSNGMPILPFQTVDPSILESERFILLQRQVDIAQYDVEIHKKFALGVACFVFALLGAPIALRFPRGGVGMTIGVSLVIFALYYVGLIAGSSLATNGHIPAWVAMWGANVLFSIVALYLLSQMGKEGSTARGGDFQEIVYNIKQRFQRRLRTPKFLSREQDIA
jgi:lipopolysaccharide export system permease protein